MFEDSTCLPSKLGIDLTQRKSANRSTQNIDPVRSNVQCMFRVLSFLEENKMRFHDNIISYSQSSCSLKFDMGKAPYVKGTCVLQTHLYIRLLCIYFIAYVCEEVVDM